MVKYKNNQSGFALLLSIVVASIVLAIGITMLNLTVKQLTLSSVARESNISFHAAEAGTDCIRYWRQKKAGKFIDDTIGFFADRNNAPNIKCFGKNSNYRFGERLDRKRSGYMNKFIYQYDWGYKTDKFCTEIDMYIMVADGNGNDYTYNFAKHNISVAAGKDGVKTCRADDVCTLTIVRGYNRACSDLASSLMTVEREITSQF